MGTGSFKVGEHLTPRYRVERLAHDVDAMRVADLYVASDLERRQAVLVRVARRQRGPDEEVRVWGLFEHEARVLDGLQHPALPRLLDVGMASNGQPMLVQELVPGRTLAWRLAQEGAVAPARAILQMMGPLLEGLAALHDAGMVHRAIWPENLIVREGESGALGSLAIGSFMTLFDPSSMSTVAASQQLVPWRYLAPEDMGYEPVSAATDVYQVALVLCEMLTGAPLVAAESLMGCLKAHQAPGGLTASLPTWLSSGGLGEVLARALEPDPAARFADARALREALLTLEPGALALPTGAQRQQVVRTLQNTAGTTSYVCQRRLGHGAHGEILEGRREDGAPVAIKLLKPPAFGEERERYLRRFVQEIEILLTLRHPNIVAAADHGVTEQGWPFMVLELLEGRSLDKVLRQDGPMAPRRAVALLSGALRGLGMAHEQGIVHKDLKPSNFFLADPGAPHERLVVMDFGVARLMAEGHVLTVLGELAGTPQYMAPEYLSDGEVTPQADVYQAALVLCEMLTGTPLMGEGSDVTMLYAHVAGEAVERLDEAGLDAELVSVLRAALERRPARRPTDASALAALLDGVDWSRLGEAARGWGAGESEAPTLAASPSARRLQGAPAAAPIEAPAEAPADTPTMVQIPAHVRVTSEGPGAATAPTLDTAMGEARSSIGGPSAGAGAAELQQDFEALVRHLGDGVAPMELLPLAARCVRAGSWPPGSPEWGVLRSVLGAVDLELAHLKIALHDKD